VRYSAASKSTDKIMLFHAKYNVDDARRGNQSAARHDCPNRIESFADLTQSGGFGRFYGVSSGYGYRNNLKKL